MASRHTHTNGWLQSMSNQGWPANRMNLSRLVVAPEVFSHIVIQSVIPHPQAVSDHINYGRHAHGVHILTIGHFHLHALLKSVVRLALQLLKKFNRESLGSWETFEEVVPPVGAFLSDSCTTKRVLRKVVLSGYRFLKNPEWKIFEISSSLLNFCLWLFL